MSGVFCFSVAFAYIHICKDSNATGRVIQWEKADRKLNRRASKSTWSYTDTIESQFGESAMDEDKVVDALFLSLNKLITQLRMYRTPIFPCCFLFRLQMKKQKRNKNDTKKGKRKGKRGAKSWGGPADERKTRAI